MITQLRSKENRLDVLAGLALFVMALLLYVQTMAPTVGAIYDDTLEFPLVVHRLAIAHPTGYPLYVLVGKLISLGAPDIAARLNLLSAICAAAAVAVLYFVARRLGIHPLGALAAGLSLAVSPVFWSQAIAVEVYAANALFVALVLALAAQWAEGGRGFASLAALAFTFGLSLTHHRTIVLIAPAVVVYLAVSQWRSAPAVEQGNGAPHRHFPRFWPLVLLVLFSLPLLFYLYLPIRGAVTSSLDGTYRNTPEGFLTWVAGSSYTAFLRDNPFRQQAMSPQSYLALLNEQVGAGGIALLVLGLLWLALRRPRALLLIFLSWLAVVVFVYLYHVADAPVFLIPSFMMATLALGAGVGAIAGRLDSAQALLARLDPLRPFVAALLVILIPGLMLLANVRLLNRSDDWAVHDYAMDVLSQPLPTGATVIGILGEMTLFRYYQETQNIRPDIETVAADTTELQLVAIDRLAQAGRSIFLTRPLAGLDKKYRLRAVGPLIQVVDPALADSLGATSSAVKSGAVFGGQITLVSYHLSGLLPVTRKQPFPQVERPAAVEAGGRLRVVLSWEAAQPVAGDYHVTVRLKSPAGRLLWQSDGRPVHGGYSTLSWRTNQPVFDVYDLLAPVGTPPGLYDVEVGVYDGASLRLLPVGQQMDLLTIGPVSVVRAEAPSPLDELPLRSPPATSGLTTPGGTFDNSLQRLGIQHIVRGNLQNEFTLYGFGLPAMTLEPGQAAEITLLWQAERPPVGDRVVFVQLLDEKGTTVASHESQPGDGTYPTHLWQRGEVIRDVHTLSLPANLADGAYRLIAGMYDPSGEPLTVLRMVRRSIDHVNLGTVGVRGRVRLRQAPTDMHHAVAARLGDVANLLGYDKGVGDLTRQADAEILSVRPGEVVHLRLVWRAMEPTQTSYTVFVHLLAPDGTVASQDDSVPGRGEWPTTSWLRGEVLLDSYTLPIPATAPAGDYQIELGLYDGVTGLRLPVWDSNGAAVGNRLLLMTKVRVERTP